MEPRSMKYRFIGADGSMGYRTGKIYRGTLETKSSVDGTVLFVTGVFPFNIFFRSYAIPYASVEKFYENWEAVK